MDEELDELQDAEEESREEKTILDGKLRSDYPEWHRRHITAFLVSEEYAEILKEWLWGKYEDLDFSDLYPLAEKAVENKGLSSEERFEAAKKIVIDRQMQD